MDCRRYLLTAATLMIFGLSHADQNFNMPCGKDRAFSGGSIGGPVTGISTVECGAMCDADPNCRSFTYHKKSRKCQLSSKIAESCNDVSQKQGAMYYQVETKYADPELPEDIDCGPDFVHLPNTTSCYRLMTDTKRWTDAVAACKTQGAYLSCPESLIEFHAIRDLIIAKSVSNVWLGVRDSDVEGVWRCTETGHVVANKNDAGYPGPMFHRAEPNGGASHDCAIITKFRDYLLGDMYCPYEYGYMCEKDQPLTTVGVGILPI